MKEYRVTTRRGLYRVEDRIKPGSDSHVPWRPRTSNYGTAAEAFEELALIKASDALEDEPWVEVSLPPQTQPVGDFLDHLHEFGKGPTNEQ